VTMRLIIHIFISVFLIGCSGAYGDLEEKYPANEIVDSEIVEMKSIILTSKVHKGDGAHSINGLSKVKINSEFMEIEINIPWYQKIQIPVEEISGCGKTCFGSDAWDADILLGELGTEISFRNSKQVLEWCWEQGLPMITSKNKRDWMYNDKTLPSKEGYQQVSKEEYTRQTKRRCAGY